MKILPIDLVYSNWVYFIKKVSIIICSRNSKGFKDFKNVRGNSKVLFFYLTAFFDSFPTLRWLCCILVLGFFCKGNIGSVLITKSWAIAVCLLIFLLIDFFCLFVDYCVGMTWTLVRTLRWGDCTRRRWWICTRAATSPTSSTSTEWSRSKKTRASDAR